MGGYVIVTEEGFEPVLYDEDHLIKNPSKVHSLVKRRFRTALSNVLHDEELLDPISYFSCVSYYLLNDMNLIIHKSINITLELAKVIQNMDDILDCWIDVFDNLSYSGFEVLGETVTNEQVNKKYSYSTAFDIDKIIIVHKILATTKLYYDYVEEQGENITKLKKAITLVKVLYKIKDILTEYFDSKDEDNEDDY